MMGDFFGHYRHGALELHLDGRAESVTVDNGYVTAIVSGLVTESTNSHFVENTNKNPAAILADAYLKWGDCFTRYLMGQFCGVVIDRHVRKVLLVQDCLGLRQIFYSFQAVTDELQFSSKLSNIVKSQNSLRLDIEYLADFLAQATCCTERTPFQGIHRLITGVNVRWQNRRLHLFRPWEPSDAVNSGHIVSSTEAEAKLLGLLDDSISPFQNMSGPIWCDLSGGLDSTTVFEVAYKRGVSVEPFSIVSRDYLDGGDTKILERLFSGRPLFWHCIDVSDAAPFAHFPDIAGDEPGGEIGFSIRRAAFYLRQKHQVTRLLSGMGGDQVFGSSDYMPNHLADYFQHLALRKLSQELRHWRDCYLEPRPLLFWFFQYSLRPLLAHIRRRRLTNAGMLYAPPSWIRYDFSRKFDIEGRSQRLLLPRHVEVGRNALWQELYFTCAVEASSRSCAYSPDYYYPLLHRPLVEFMLTRPYEERRRADRDRVLQRRALRNILPAVVLKRDDKGTGQSSFDHSFSEAYEWHRILKNNPRLVDLGVFEPKAWNNAIDRARFGLYESLPHFCASVCCEIWLRSR